MVILFLVKTKVSTELKLGLSLKLGSSNITLTMLQVATQVTLEFVAYCDYLFIFGQLAFKLRQLVVSMEEVKWKM
ncbi:Uncharacterized protein TCM_027076 [Theobroma cacao]|uniref:Uncharacterized protein n=1 Tax=Theobroma cacao TaxID=3641 RepID=A0A061G816_THECC|nr:Uncharacterized protein TCM_027076 [Theobroma cacao]